MPGEHDWEMVSKAGAHSFSRYERLKLSQLRKLSKFKKAGNVRIVLTDISKGFQTASWNDGMKSTETTRIENSAVIDAIEFLLLRYGKANPSKQTQVNAALFFLSQFHQGAATLTEADLENIFLILDSDKTGTERFTLLQSLAITISKDERFVELVKIAHPGYKRAFSQATIVDCDTRWTLFYKALGIAVPPFGLARVCWNLCEANDHTMAFKTVADLAHEMHAPLAFVMATAKEQQSYLKEVRLASQAAMTIISAASINPAGMVLPMGVQHVLPQLATSLITYQTSAYTLPPAVFAVKQMLYAVGDRLIRGQTSGPVGLPVFPVRRNQGDAESSGEDVPYKFTDPGLISALISYVAPAMAPQFYTSKNLDSKDETRFQQEQARLIFKNLLGSPNYEDCAAPIDEGRTPVEYISARLNASKASGNFTGHGGHRNVKSWSGVVGRQAHSSSMRPISFARLLLVAGGGVSHSLKGFVHGAHDGGVRRFGQASGHTDSTHNSPHDTQWKVFDQGASFQSQMASLRSQHGKKAWSVQEEANFDTLGEYHPALDYFVPPWVGYLPKSVAEVDTKIGFKFKGVAALDFGDYEAMFAHKVRWVGDFEGMHCCVCAKDLSWSRGYRHHCRMCGGHACDAHANKKNRIKMIDRDTGQLSSVRVCETCRTNPNLGQPALRPGDVDFRPYMAKGPGGSSARRRSTSF